MGTRKCMAAGLLVALLLGVGGCGEGDGDDADSDADIDLDVDVDTDADTDSDSDDPCAISDADGDGHDSEECGGSDCDDGDRDVHPGAPDNEGTGEWIVETVDDAGESHGTITSLAVDAAGAVHISYSRDGFLGYATNESGEWVLETVGGAHTGVFNALAFDADGAVHIAYGYDDDEDNSGVRYATNESGEWVSETVDEDSPGRWISLALDAEGAAHISYAGLGAGLGDGVYRGLRYATNESGAWVLETADASVLVSLGPTSLEVGSEGTVHIATGEIGAGIRHATNATGEWVVEVVDPDGYSATLALDSTDTVCIGYRGGGVLNFATNATGDWVFESFDDPEGSPGYPVLAFDLGDAMHVSYTAFVDFVPDPDEAHLRYATNVSGEWVLETVVPLEFGGAFASPLAIDAAGAAHISYTDHWRDDNMDLRHATNRAVPDGVDQNCDGVDGVDADGDGHASIATGGDDCDDGDSEVFEGCG